MNKRLIAFIVLVVLMLAIGTVTVSAEPVDHIYQLYLNEETVSAELMSVKCISGCD